MSTTLNGLASVRAYRAQSDFEKQFYSYQNQHNSTYFIYLASAQTLALYIDWLCAIYVIITIIVVMVYNKGS